MLLLSSGLLSGCGVQVTDHTPASSNAPRQVAAPKTQATHDLAIAAIDFDPAINSTKLPPGKPVSVLVAVENKGNRTEGSFEVTAQLLTQDRKQVLMSDRRIVKGLAAGNITVVRFPASAKPPMHRVYILNVQVQLLPSEKDVANNKRTLEIKINTGN